MALGAFSIIAAIFNFNWFFSTNSAAIFVKWFGKKGARIFYGLLGLCLISAGASIFIYK
jgi:hypothetical protein